ncbi:AAA family ATPase [Candidatus Woesearchaeota archaeon]|nr:AAA family ATPase [Candidatus Woesearchaeota archaeon]
MIIKKIRLKNIRSYIDEELNFPLGITLLSGDIGSGKSTILLAIDFALFGIRRGELSGNALLRNGTTDGFVNLNFLIDNKDIHIKRVLKKTSNGILQDSGYLTINDVTVELTPVELKQRILQLLNYPQEMLTKKSLIYRYTVYTPQEEMKLILLGEKEARIEALRKVFNIDKYKRIKENSKFVLGEVKSRKKEFILLSSDLENKKLNLKEKEIEFIKVNESIELNKNRLKVGSELLLNKKQSILEFEESIKNFNNFKKDFDILNNNIKNKFDIKSRNLNQLSLLEKQILDLNNNIKIINFEDLKNKILDNEKLLENLERELREITNNKIEISTKKKSSEEIKSSISKLDFCPLCKQNISLDHKHAVNSREDELIIKLNEDIGFFLGKENELLLKIKEIKDLIKEHKNHEKEYEINKIRLNDLEQKKNLFNNLKKEQEEIEIFINTLNSKKALLENDINSLKNIENDYLNAKKEYELLLEEQRKLELNVALLNKDFYNLNSEITKIEIEIENKEKAKEKLDYYNKLQDWLENFFVNTMELIERKVMLKVHTDFNLLFQKWFNMLIDNEIIKVRLDEEFTPLIEQNGHDIEYENLSGGEKTACALSYRLALNQVINTIISFINTKDLIILDEPTDGFSSEQLDKIRGLLDELNMKQILIVSHESKIESFVQNIIRVNKKGHVSSFS